MWFKNNIGLFVVLETINMVHTPHSNSSLPNEIYNTTWIEMPKEKYFQFWVKSNEDARILLADDNVGISVWFYSSINQQYTANNLNTNSTKFMAQWKSYYLIIQRRIYISSCMFVYTPRPL